MKKMFGKRLAFLLAATLLAAGIFTSCGNSYLAVEGTVVTGVKDRTKVPADVKIPNGITEISSRAFEKCKAIKSVTFPKSLKKIGKEAFKDCDYLENVTFPESVTEIGDSAFENCTSLKSVTIPENVTALPGVFNECTGLTSVTFADPNNWYYISAFGDRELDVSNSEKNAYSLKYGMYIEKETN